MDQPVPDEATVSNISGGINLTSDQANIGGDAVGRDKVTQVQGDLVNNYIQSGCAEVGRHVEASAARE